jgi:Raf kinase inhibitor-like YbhB/YbcL family protein
MKKEMEDVMYKSLHVTSTAFQNKEIIPVKYTCDGANVNPPLHIDHIPEEAKCLALIVDDPDASSGTFVHWVVWNIPITHHIAENSIPGEEGMNDFKKRNWGGPCPPSGTHRYFFKIYALKELLDLTPSAKKAELEQKMGPHILAFGELIGLYKRVRG